MASAPNVVPDYLRELASRLERGEPTAEDRRVLGAIAAVLHVEDYTDERIAEFERAAEMTPVELGQARAAWGA
jgi:methylphosphotriester-DNA--protein-cysteine methyltransferase